ncbi:MAG: hypothetical protein AB7U20_22280 [Planctomycetaceae bacterium]
MRLGLACVSLLSAIVGTADIVLAHPGHGATDPQTVQHYFAEPVHLAPLLVIVAACAVTISLLAVRRRRSG